MKILEPTGCVYWTKPELAFRPGRTLDQFETIETLERNMHELKQLLKCRECGQQYFYEFWEEMHFDGRDDSQFVTLVPVESAGDVEFLSKKTFWSLRAAGICLCEDCPGDFAPRRFIYWMTYSGENRELVIPSHTFRVLPF